MRYLCCSNAFPFLQWNLVSRSFWACYDSMQIILIVWNRSWSVHSDLFKSFFHILQLVLVFLDKNIVSALKLIKLFYMNKILFFNGLFQFFCLLFKNVESFWLVTNLKLNHHIFQFQIVLFKVLNDSFQLLFPLNDDVLSFFSFEDLVFKLNLLIIVGFMEQL